jgi:hypothetical protein
LLSRLLEANLTIHMVSHIQQNSTNPWAIGHLPKLN